MNARPSRVPPGPLTRTLALGPEWLQPAVIIEWLGPWPSSGSRSSSSPSAGRFAFVRENVEFVLILIVLLSVLPIVVEIIRARRTPGAHTAR